MPRRVATEDGESRAIRQFDDEDAQTLHMLVQQAGPPPDAERMSETDEDDAWAQMDPNVADHEQMAQLLAVQGLPPEIAQRLLITKLRGEDGWMEALTQPTGSLDQANQLMKLAKYPFRLSLLESYDDPEEQVRKAESLDRRYQKAMAAHLDQPVQIGRPGQTAPQQAPTPAPIPPSMPTQPPPGPAPMPDPRMMLGG